MQDESKNNVIAKEWRMRTLLNAKRGDAVPSRKKVKYNNKILINKILMEKYIYIYINLYYTLMPKDTNIQKTRHTSEHG